MCTSATIDELNKLMQCENEDASTLIVNFGPYMNWGKWNHNTSRINPLIDHLLANGYHVQLQHSEQETSRNDHGFVRILRAVEGGEAEELAFSATVQHNNNYDNAAAQLVELGDLAIESLKSK